MLMIGAGAMAVAVLILTTLMFMIFRRKKPAKGSVQTQAALAGRGGTAAAIQGAEPDAIQHQIKDKMAERQALQAQADEAALTSLKLPTISTKKSEVLVKHLRESVTKDTPGSANILRSWLTESGTE
jgi:flagellar biosynthesis/type III secretory pathway M-ring protein FliF/YscJ